MDRVPRYSWFRSARAPGVLLIALIVLLGVGGYVLTSTAIRHDRDGAAEQRAQVEAVHAQEVLGRARAFVSGLAEVMAGEREPGQARFARWASATSASVGLNDVLWIEQVPASRRRRYERLRGVRITRVAASGRLVPAPPARSYLPATFTSESRPDLRPGVDMSGGPALAAAIRDRARIFAVGASRPGELAGESGFYLLEAASFAQGRRHGFLVAFVPRGWFSTSLGGDPRRVAVSEDGRGIEGKVDSAHAAAGFEMLGRHWSIDVAREPASGLRSLLPWLALAWPFAVAGIAVPIGRATTLRRRAQREVERIFEMSRDMISVIGFDGRFKAVNPAFGQTLGYSTAEMLARPFADFVHPDDLDASRAAFAGLVGGAEATEFENRYVRADGAERWLQWSVRAVPEQGVVYCIARDVTERRRIDADLREARRTAEARGAELQVRAAEQTALRRVATLVAQAAPPAEIFAAVSDEVGRLLGGDGLVMRFEPEGPAIVVVGGATALRHVRVGTRWDLEDSMVSTQVYRTGRPVRIDGMDWSTVSAPIAEVGRATGAVSTVACPIVVEGRRWGVVTVSSKDTLLPADTEDRLAQFTDLVATAIANAESREAIGELAGQQSALRRVATLVAQGASPSAVLDAVAAEMEGVLRADAVTLSRYESGTEVTVVAHRGSDPRRVPLGTRVSHQGENVTTMVRRTEHSARMEHHDGAHDAIAAVGREVGVRASVGAPIVVEGRLWGVAVATWRGEPPADTEARMTQFAQMLDTAIANADSRNQLDASRARLVTEADEARRRVVRDLHDGAQQRLVHTIVTLKLARNALAGDDGEAASFVREALEQAERGNAELRELAHGILPTVLARGGLQAGVDAVAARLGLPVHIELPEQRLPTEIERSAYFIVAESLTNIVKHADAHRAEVKAVVADGKLRIEVRDDGIGGADPDGHGLVGLRDRATALGGQLRVDSPPGGGTVVDAELPLLH